MVACKLIASSFMLFYVSLRNVLHGLIYWRFWTGRCYWLL